MLAENEVTYEDGRNKTFSSGPIDLVTTKEVYLMQG
jgi:hypothetical protein